MKERQRERTYISVLQGNSLRISSDIYHGITSPWGITCDFSKYEIPVFQNIKIKDDQMMVIISFPRNEALYHDSFEYVFFFFFSLFNKIATGFNRIGRPEPADGKKGIQACLG